MPDTSTEHEGQAGEAKHWPLPWKVCGASDGKCSCGLLWSIPKDQVVGQVWFECEEGGYAYPRAEVHANAALIVRAVNNHDTLRTALVEAVDGAFDAAAAVDLLRTSAEVEGSKGAEAMARELAASLRAKAEAWRKVLEVSR